MNIGEMFVRLGLQVTDFSKGVADAQKELSSLERSFTATGQSLSLALTAPMAAVGGLSLKTFAGFEQAMLKVSALAEVTGEGLERLKNQALQLGADTQFSAKQAADAMGEYAAAGFSATQIYAAMPGVLDLAAAGQMQVAQAAEISAAVLRGFGMEASETGRVADVLAKAAGESAASVADLGSSFQYVGSIASTLGVRFEEISAALVLLGNEGVKGETAGTALRAMFQDLLAPSAKAKAAMDSMHISLKDVNGKFLSLSQILKQFKDQGLASGPEGAAKAFEIWGMRASDVIRLVKHAGTEFDNVVSSMDKAKGAAQKMREVLQQGLGGAWEQFMGSLETVGIKLGEILAKSAKPIVEWAKNLADKLLTALQWFDKLPKGVQVATVAFAAFVAAIGPVVLGLGMMAGAISNLTLLPGMLSSLGAAMMSQTGVFKTFASTITTVFSSLSVTGLKGMSAAFASSFKEMYAVIAAGVAGLPGKLSGIKAAILGVGPMIASAGAVIAKEAKGLVVVVAAEFYALKDAMAASGGISGALTALKASFGTFSSSIVTSVPAAIAACRAAMVAFGSSLITVGAPIAAIIAAVAALAAIGYVLYKNWEDVKAVMIGLWKDLQIAFTAFGNWFIKTIESVFGSTVAGYVKAVWNGIVSFFKGVWDGLVMVVQNGLKWTLQAAKAAADAVGAQNTSSALGAWIAKLDGMDAAAKKSTASVSASMSAMGASALGTVPSLKAVASATGGIAGAAGDAKSSIDALKKAKAEAAATASALAKALHNVREIMLDMPKSASEFVERFTKLKDVPPELQKMGSYIDSLKDKYKSMGLQAAEAFEKGNKALGEGIKGLMVGFDLAIKEQERFMAQYAKMLDMDKDFSGIVKGLDAMNSSLETSRVKMLALPPILEQMSQVNFDNMLKAPINEAGALAEAFKQLGISSSQSLTEAANKAKVYYDTIASAYQQGKASANDMKAALLALTDAQIKTGSYGGEALDALRAKSAKLREELEASGYAIKGHGSKMKSYWQDLDNQISTIFDDFGKGIADAIFSAKSLGEFFSKVFEDMGKTIVRFTVEYWTKIWLTDLYKGIKGLHEFGSAAKKATADLAGTTVTAAKTGEQITKTVGDTTTTATKAGSSLAGAGGLLGAVSAIGSIVSAIMDVLSYFQGRRIEKDVGRIEVTSRGMLNQLISIQETLNKYLPWIENTRFLQALDLQLSQVADVVTENFNRLLDALQSGIPVSATPTQEGSGEDTADKVSELLAQVDKLKAELAKASATASKSSDAMKDAAGDFVDASSSTAQTYQASTEAFSTQVGDFGDSLSSSATAVDDNTSQLAAFSSNVTQVNNAWVKTSELFSDTVDQVTSVWTRTGGTPGSIGGTGTTPATELQRQIDALGAYLGVGKNAPIYSDPMWQKYFDLLREQQASQTTTPGTPGGITFRPIEGSTTQPLFPAWPTYQQLFGDPNLSVYERSLAAATDTLSGYTGAVQQQVTPVLAQPVTTGEQALQQPNAGSAIITNNFYGVTDPAIMANKIVTGLRTRGVDI